MNRKSLTVAALSGLVSMSVVLAAGMGQPGGGGGADGQPPARGPGGEGGRGRQPGQPGGAGARAQSVEGAMRALGRAIEPLAASIGDASKKEENLRLLGEAQRAAVSAKNAKPTAATDAAKDEAAKAEVAAAFRRMMIDLVKALIDAEVATLDGKTAEAKAAFDKAMAIEKKGHEKFQPKDER